jgi:hypothetical protein
MEDQLRKGTEIANYLSGRAAQLQLILHGQQGRFEETGKAVEVAQNERMSRFGRAKCFAKCLISRETS